MRRSCSRSVYIFFDMLKEQTASGNFTPCILEVDGFGASFLFSLETQHTIGKRRKTRFPVMILAVIVYANPSRCIKLGFFLFSLSTDTANPPSSPCYLRCKTLQSSQGISRVQKRPLFDNHSSPVLARHK